VPGAIAVSPSPLEVPQNGSASTTISEANYGGAFTVTSSAATPCGGLVTFTQPSRTALTATAGSAVGSCDVVVAGAPGQTAPLHVDVSGASVIITSRNRSKESSR
jgi:hypothetical protein